MKRKQQDFQKVKLKVGKHLPKGRNETKTSFQTKKIALREQIRETAEDPTLKEILNFMKSTDVKTKYDNLRKLHKYVSQNRDTLSMFFPDILKELGRTLQESDPEIRSQTILVLGQCAEILTDIQFKSFVVPLTSYLNCMMTHMTFSVKQDSLKFFDVLLNSHPNVICQSIEILFYLLNLISCKESSVARRGSKNIKGGKKLIDVINSKISADDWRILVLERMLTFLNGMLSEKNSTKMITDDEKQVHWDAKETLYLPLYLNSGVEPAKFDYSLYSSVNSEGNDSRVKIFLQELLCTLSAILKGFSSNKSFSEANIKYLSIITQILCCAGEWIIQNLDSEADLDLVQNLIIVCNQLLKGFPYNQQAGKSAKRYEVECVHLNLGIAYLYCMSSFLTDKTSYTNPEKSYFEKWEVIKMYLVSVFEVSGIKMNEKSISQVLKICRILVQCSKLDMLAKDGVLVALLGTMDTNKLSTSANDIYSFFMDLSLDYDHKNLLVTQAMRSWFQSLIKNLNFMMESRVLVLNYLDYIKQICSRRNPYFMEALKNLSSDKIIEFLKYEDTEFQLTVIHLIISLDNISPDLLQAIAETIRNEKFSLKTATKLIRMLHSRFSNSCTPLVDQMNFVKFLLNLGCDTFLLLDPSLDVDPMNLTQVLLDLQQSFLCQYEIYPTNQFERHQEISKVCTECLTSYMRNENLRRCTQTFFITIFKDHLRYPLHSVVFIFDIFKRFMFLSSDIEVAEYLHDFMYSCLLYNSFATNEIPDVNWIEYCVPSVQDCFDQINPVDVIGYLDSQVHNFDESQLYHALRIMVFLMQRNLFEEMDRNSLYIFLNKLSKVPAYPKRPIFRQLMEHICLSMRQM